MKTKTDNEYIQEAINDSGWNGVSEPTGAQIDDARWAMYTIDPVTRKVIHKNALIRLTRWRKRLLRLLYGSIFLILAILLLTNGG